MLDVAKVVNSIVIIEFVVDGAAADTEKIGIDVNEKSAAHVNAGALSSASIVALVSTRLEDYVVGLACIFSLFN